MNKKTALFLYATENTGHHIAALAIESALQEIAPGITSICLDSFNYAYPTIGKIISRIYVELVMKTPEIWEYLYDNPEVLEATQDIRDFLNKINSKKIKKILSEFKADAIICTQAVPCSVVANEKREGRLDLPLVAVITDFAAHSYWVYNEVNYYVVANEEIKLQLIRNGVEEHKIKIYGIPVHPKFSRTKDKIKARRRLRINPLLPTILLMGGGRGLGKMEDVLFVLGQVPQELQAIVVAGENKKKINILKRKAKKLRISVRVFGYTKNIDLLMDASDMIITKPGGMTISECLVKGLPILVFNPLPGQEERNSQYLLSRNLAKRVDTLEELARVTYSLMSNKRELNKMCKRASYVSKPNAAEHTAALISDIIFKLDKKQLERTMECSISGRY